MAMRLILLAFASVVACGRPTAPAVPSQTEPPQPQRWLLEDGRRAVISGAEQPRILIAEAGAVGDRFSSVAAVGDEDCLLMMARGSDKVLDLDLYAYAEDGRLLDMDDKPSAKPTLLICPPHPKHVYLTARIATGQGLVVVGVHRVPLAAAQPVRHALHLEAPRASAFEEAHDPDLEARVLAHHRAIGGSWVAVAHASIAVDARLATATGFEVPENSCLDIYVMPSPRASTLEAQLYNDRGFSVARSVAGEHGRWLVACANERRPVTLQVRAHDGFGTATILVSRGTFEYGRNIRGAADLSESQPLEKLVDTERKDLARLGYGREATLANFTVERGYQRRVAAKGVQGCTRFDIYAGAPSLGIQARLYKGNGDFLAGFGGLQHFPLLGCLAGSMTLVVETQDRGGPILIEQRSEPKPANQAISLPRAAARMFQRSWSLGLITSFGQFADLESTVLDADHVWERTLELEAGQCRGYVLALDGDAAGVDLRVINQQSEEIISGEEHADAAHVEFCAAPDAKRGKYTLSAMLRTGKSAALLGTLNHH